MLRKILIKLFLEKLLESQKKEFIPKDSIIECQFCNQPWAKTKKNIHNGEVLYANLFIPLNNNNLQDNEIILCNKCFKPPFYSIMGAQSVNYK